MKPLLIAILQFLTCAAISGVAMSRVNWDFALVLAFLLFEAIGFILVFAWR